MPNNHFGKLFWIFSTFRSRIMIHYCVFYYCFDTDWRLMKLSERSQFFSTVLCFTPKDFVSRHLSILLPLNKDLPSSRNLFSSTLHSIRSVLVFLWQKKLRNIFSTLYYDVTWEHVEVSNHKGYRDRAEGRCRLERARQALFSWLHYMLWSVPWWTPVSC